MKKISAEIVADSVDPRGNRITSFLLTYPRFIHGEIMAHRMFSRNSASSRAIPFEKVVKMVEKDPFIPIAWQKQHKGMQGTEYLTKEDDILACIHDWGKAREQAINWAKILHNTDRVTKQLCNRLLEPYMWHQTLITATEFENFFELRCPQYEGMGKLFRSKKDYIEYHNNNSDLDWTDAVPDATFRAINKSQAEIHIQALAESMWNAYNESNPKELSSGNWYIPFGDKIFSEDYIENFLREQPNVQWVTAEGHDEELEKLAIKIATARCARLSYNTHDGEIDYKKDIQLHDKLLDSRHLSPFEHCARVATEDEYYSNYKGSFNETWNLDLVTDNTYEVSASLKEDKFGWFNNFKGFIPYRYLIENSHD